MLRSADNYRVPTTFLGMSDGHVSLPALDLEREQREINDLIASLQRYKPTGKATKDQISSTSVPTTPKYAPSRVARGRPPKKENKEVPSSPAAPVGETCAAGFELIIECLNRLNSQNQKLSNRVSELDIIVEKNKIKPSSLS